MLEPAPRRSSWARSALRRGGSASTAPRHSSSPIQVQSEQYAKVTRGILAKKERPSRLSLPQRETGAWKRCALPSAFAPGRFTGRLLQARSYRSLSSSYVIFLNTSFLRTLLLQLRLSGAVGYHLFASTDQAFGFFDILHNSCTPPWITSWKNGLRRALRFRYPLEERVFFPFLRPAVALLFLL